MENYLWFYSTVAQVFAALWAVTGMFAVFRLELVDRKIKDALLSLLNFLLVKVKTNATGSLTQKEIEKLQNWKQWVIDKKVEESDKKEYFKWDPEILLNKVTETKYIIKKYNNFFEKVLESIDKQKKQVKELPREQQLEEKIIKKYQALKDVYDNEGDYKKYLIKNLTWVTILDGLIIGISLLVLFFLSRALPLKAILFWIQIFVLLASLFAIGLSARFIWRYCRRR